MPHPAPAARPHRSSLPRLPWFLLCLTLAPALPAADSPAPDSPLVLPIWPAATGAPGSAHRRHEPEKIVGPRVSNIHEPTLTVYLPPPADSTGCAVVVAPGGGHLRLAIEHEGYAVARWLAAHGIAAFVLKYRLGKDDATPAGAPQPYTVDRDALADAQRALRLIRSRAAEWKINPAAVGLIGFSAGGEVAALAAMRASPGDPAAPDPLDRLGARPDFQALIYPGKSPLILPEKGAPPVFLACGYGDRPDIAEGLAEVYLRFKRAAVPAELHIYAGAGHGFGVKPADHSPVATWPLRFREWLADRKFLPAK